MYEYRGLVKKLGQTERVKDTFSKRKIVISDEADQYPQLIEFEAQQKGCDMLDRIREGDWVTCKFEVRGRAWSNPKTGTMSYFVTLKLVDIAPIGKPKVELPERDISDLFA